MEDDLKENGTSALTIWMTGGLTRVKPYFVPFFPIYSYNIVLFIMQIILWAASVPKVAVYNLQTL